MNLDDAEAEVSLIPRVEDRSEISDQTQRMFKGLIHTSEGIDKLKAKLDDQHDNTPLAKMSRALKGERK